ncbi:MAG: hypothetical protein IT496_09295 [Gammaproteobacteria bacterium]|nr:hypothetical protein [Gammaproteobacteria bacterium]MCG3145904.1 hypothetical protein [Gammaproteobacteria bacterium]
MAESHNQHHDGGRRARPRPAAHDFAAASFLQVPDQAIDPGIESGTVLRVATPGWGIDR